MLIMVKTKARKGWKGRRIVSVKLPAPVLRLCIRETKRFGSPQGIRLSLTPASGKCQYPYQLQPQSPSSSPLSLWRSVCGVLSFCVAFQAQLMRIMSTTTMSQSRQTKHAGSQLSAELTFVYCLWLRFCLLPRESEEGEREVQGNTARRQNSLPKHNIPF